jgi:adenine deaminase
MGKGFVHGTGLKRGAIAASFTAGIQNVMVAGVDDADMATCIARLKEMGGGAVVVRDGEVLAEVALPLYGMMSERPAEEVVEAMTRLEAALRDGLECPFRGFLSNVGFTLLAVSIPSLKIHERGLAMISRDGFEPVDLIVAEVESMANPA